MKIENRLRELAAQNHNYSMLLAQWEFDKRLLTQSLTTISRDFPHYSLHDASHSNTIITQIEKVIKPNIDKLSAVDCWLILESCYWHDSGMIISNNEKLKLLKDGDFLNYLDELTQTENDLTVYAKKLKNPSNRPNLETLFESSHAFTFIFAAYYRSKHANRSEDFVNLPHKIKVDSPRTYLIPIRLFGLIAEITSCHGKASESILLLPKIADGMDADDYAHPRYIAALLRIGDLLDIDSGRFCPTLLASIGQVPESSLHHQEKHSSIKNICITPELIELEAECESYEGYFAQQSWFSYIEKEFDYQKRVWNEITPSYDYAALPTLGIIRCSIKDYITIDNNVPELKLNDRIYSYISSQAIYDDEFIYLREIIQNSIDALQLSVWEKFYHEHANANDKNVEISSLEAKNLYEDELRKKVIDISVDEKKKDGDGDKIRYQIKIKDIGIGLSLDDIKKILNVGSHSTTVSRKQKILNTMPAWAKPSGFFGIGLQSVFEMCDDVCIKSKQSDKQVGFILEIKKREGKLPSIFIKQFEDRWFSGTEVMFSLLKDRIPNTIKDVGNSFEILNDTDPLKVNVIPVIPEYIQGYILEKFPKSPVAIRSNGTLLAKAKQESNLKNILYDFYHDIAFNLQVTLTQNAHQLFYFKNIKCDAGIYLQGITGEINIFSHDAQYWLTIDRKKILKTRSDELVKIINYLLQEHHHEIYNNSDKANILATEFYFHAFNIGSYQGWGEYKILGHTISSLFNGEFHLDVTSASLHEYDSGYKSYLSFNNIVFKLLGKIVHKHNQQFYLKFNSNVKSEDIFSNIENKEYPTYKLHFTKSLTSQLIDVDVIKKIVKSEKRFGATSRSYLPCYDTKYHVIAVNEKNVPPWAFIIFDFINFLDWFEYYLFLPSTNGTSIADDIDIIYNFYKTNNIIHSKLTEAQFKEIYKEMWLEIGVIDIDDKKLLNKKTTT